MNSKGFTLLELLVIVSIIASLSAVVLGGYNTGETKFTLLRSANKLAQDIRKAENMAMIGKSAPLSFGEIFPEGGYGIYITASSASTTAPEVNSYNLFCDCNGNKEYESEGAAGSCASSTVANPFRESMEVMSLETDVDIESISSATGTLSSIAITFFPPDPIIRIVGPNSERYDEITITLDLYGEEKTLTINNVGLIDID